MWSLAAGIRLIEDSRRPTPYCQNAACLTRSYSSSKTTQTFWHPYIRNPLKEPLKEPLKGSLQVAPQRKLPLVAMSARKWCREHGLDERLLFELPPACADVGIGFRVNGRGLWWAFRMLAFGALAFVTCKV